MGYYSSLRCLYGAGLVAEYIFEEFARISVEEEYASEFRYRNPIINSRMWLSPYLSLVKQLRWQLLS
jgi:glucosamine 6-phosphate synthetase-like amidotransferase/phosphosugar isomerase protein